MSKASHDFLLFQKTPHGVLAEDPAATVPMISARELVASLRKEGAASKWGPHDAADVIEAMLARLQPGEVVWPETEEGEKRKTAIRSYARNVSGKYKGPVDPDMLTVERLCEVCELWFEIGTNNKPNLDDYLQKGNFIDKVAAEFRTVIVDAMKTLAQAGRITKNGAITTIDVYEVAVRLWDQVCATLSMRGLAVLPLMLVDNTPLETVKKAAEAKHGKVPLPPQGIHELEQDQIGFTVRKMEPSAVMAAEKYGPMGAVMHRYLKNMATQYKVDGPTPFNTHIEMLCGVLNAERITAYQKLDHAGVQLNQGTGWGYPDSTPMLPAPGYEAESEPDEGAKAFYEWVSALYAVVAPAYNGSALSLDDTANAINKLVKLVPLAQAKYNAGQPVVLTIKDPQGYEVKQMLTDDPKVLASLPFKPLFGALSEKGLPILKVDIQYVPNAEPVVVMHCCLESFEAHSAFTDYLGKEIMTNTVKGEGGFSNVLASMLGGEPEQEPEDVPTEEAPDEDVNAKSLDALAKSIVTNDLFKPKKKGAKK